MAESAPSAKVDKATPFQRALEEYIKSLPEKKRKRKFIVDCQRSADGVITAETILESIKKVEEKNSKQTLKRVIRRTLAPIVRVLRDYYVIIDTLVSTYPTPATIIWGSLKVVIDGADRFLNLFETIKDELQSLTAYLERITMYEWLYEDSTALQNLLCRSYINILRFWSRVDKECDRSCFSALLSATASFSTTKLRKIVDDIRVDADQIEKLADIIEAAKARGERENAELERFMTGIERITAQKEREENSEWREQQKIDRQGELYSKVQVWLCSQNAYEANQRRYRVNKARRLNGTCDWLFSNPIYVTWLNGTTTSPIIWLHGRPGCGKSTLCSHMIHTINESEPSAAVAFHFYQFDQAYLALEILRLLAAQLFEKYWDTHHLVSEEINIKTYGTSSSLENVQALIKILIASLPKTYFILDGLDEEREGARWSEALTVLEFLVQLSRDYPKSTRLWYSSQFQPCVDEKLSTFSTFDAQGQVSSDVTHFLTQKLDSLEVSEEEKSRVLENMKSRAEGNFLWANLMIETLNEANSPKEVKQFIENGPLNLDGYYRKIFDRFEKVHRSLASKLFALIVYARRPLRLGELREAIGLLQSNTPTSLKDVDLPFTRSLRKLFAPLIEIQEDCNNLDECTCRLFHSTVREFLVKNPDILSDGAGGLTLRINSYDLLTRANTRWVDALGESVERHHFLLYAAKYWDKHLIDVPETKPLRARVQKFLTSPNFQTCIQVQSLWVDAQFQIFRVVGQPDSNTYLRRVFPVWFFRPRGDKLWKDYRVFMHEWQYLLRCGSCDNPQCEFLPYAGETDRILWAALGSQNFMSKFQGRYTSFAFESEEVANHPLSQCYEGISVEGDEVRLLRLVSRSHGQLKFICEHWVLMGNLPPVLRKKQLIWTDETSTNWLLYIKYPGDIGNMLPGRAQSVAFSSDFQFLRIGCQIFAADLEGNYTSLLKSMERDDLYPSYVEEFASRGRYTILASRRIVLKDNIHQWGIHDTKITGLGTDFTKMEEMLCETVAKPYGYGGDEAGTESSYLSSAESTDSSNNAYETWSERSTEESDSQFEDDLITPWTGRVAGFGESSPSSSSAPVSENDESEDEGKSAGNKTSESSDSEILPSYVVGYGRYRGDTSSDEDENDRTEHFDSYYRDFATAEAYRNYQQRKAFTEPRNFLVVFDTSSPVPKKIFQFTRPLPFMIYGSPPVIHPSETLFVWPLSGGDIMFADFLTRTYFVRKLRPSTMHTRHIFIKCHFSLCGRYLHVASVEGQRKPEHRKNKGAESTPLGLALLVLTYRLSRSKRTRGPPSLIYRTRTDLGTVECISVSRLPFTLTWTPDHLYFTCSRNVLGVYRIRLFRASENDKISPLGHHGDVLIPQKTIFLPNTAKNREIYYFPPSAANTDVRVIIGSETQVRDTLNSQADDKFYGIGAEASARACATHNVFGLRGMSSPPIGLYLKNTDLGDWVRTKKVSKLPKDLGIGRLDHRLEKFNPDDDCDLEPYIF